MGVLLRNGQVFASLSKCVCSPCGVNDMLKTIYKTTLPLLVRNVQYVCGAAARNLWNINKNKLKTLNFLSEFLKSASSPCPVNRRICWNRLECRDVLKTNENAMILHGLDVREDVVRVFVLSTTLLSIDDLRWTFLVSRGRFTFSWFNFLRSFRSRIEIS